MSFYDSTCPKCRTRYGWGGDYSQKPACPKCKYRPSQEELDREQQELDEQEARILAKIEKEIEEEDRHNKQVMLDRLSDNYVQRYLGED